MQRFNLAWGDAAAAFQIVMATHSPLLMAYPGAALLRLTKHALEPVRLEDADRFRLPREFRADPQGFVETMARD